MPTIPRLIAFDLDDTLAPSKTPLNTRMTHALLKLLELTEVAVISGGQFEQFERQLLTQLAQATETMLERLHLLPTCGTRYEQRKNGAWTTLYQETLNETERTLALTALSEEAKKLGLWESQHWGNILEDRGSQITFSALGQHAPVPEKQQWDTDGTKKSMLRAAVAARLPHLEVRSGGTTSVDITRKGIDKAYGMRKLSEHTGIPQNEIVFFGDRLDPDGNDYPVKAMGITCIAVNNWEHTATLLENMLHTEQHPH